MGLPESWEVSPWRVMHRRGTFDRGGEPPPIADPRVRFVKGWFQETLPEFLKSFKPDAPLVVHHDSDLYSSTLYCLTMLDGMAVPGTVLVFDEFYIALHEFRAFMDYVAAYRRSYEVLGVTARYAQVAIRLGPPLSYTVDQAA